MWPSSVLMLCQDFKTCPFQQTLNYAIGYGAVDDIRNTHIHVQQNIAVWSTLVLYFCQPYPSPATPFHPASCPLFLIPTAVSQHSTITENAQLTLGFLEGGGAPLTVLFTKAIFDFSKPWGFLQASRYLPLGREWCCFGDISTVTYLWTLEIEETVFYFVFYI